MSVAIPLEQIVLAQEAEFTLGGLKVCPPKREVLAGARREVLQPRIMQVFVVLARRRGAVVTRDELIAACWGGFAVSDDAIHRCIARLRRLAEAHGGFTLETVPRVGYQLSEKRTALFAEPERILRQRPEVLVLGLIAIVVLLAVLTVGARLL